jgi:hypothetical protein
MFTLNQPMEAVVTEEDEERFQSLLEFYRPVKYTAMTEIRDETNLQPELACAGGKCEL